MSNVRPINVATRIPFALNVPGDFYVEDGCCVGCAVPFEEAPGHFSSKSSKEPAATAMCVCNRETGTKPLTWSEQSPSLRSVAFDTVAKIRKCLLSLWPLENGSNVTCFQRNPFKYRRAKHFDRRRIAAFGGCSGEDRPKDSLKKVHDYCTPSVDGR